MASSAAAVSRLTALQTGGVRPCRLQKRLMTPPGFPVPSAERRPSQGRDQSCSEEGWLECPGETGYSPAGKSSPLRKRDMTLCSSTTLPAA